METSIPEAAWQVKADDPLALTQLLGLPEFVVLGLEHDDREDRLFVFCERAWDVAVCPECGQISVHVHQSKRRCVRDLPLAGYVCYLEFTARRFRCASCQRPFTEPLESVASHARYTERYAQYLFEQCRGTSLLQVSRRERIGYRALERLYYRLAEQQAAQRAQGQVRRLGLDEIALKKGHAQFVLVVSDLEQGRVLAVLPERTKEALEAYLDTWSEEQRAAVEDVATDLWLPYSLAVEAKLPNAQINADRFHVMKNLNDQVSQARRDMQREALPEEKKQLKGCRWLLVKNQEDLSEEEQAQLAQLYAVSPPLKRLHQLKEEFRTIFETVADRTTAEERLTDWMQQAEQTGLKPLSKFLTTLRNWWEKILNYFNAHITSGLVEGLNNKIKLIKRLAYGFRNFRHFQLRLLIECDGAT